MQLRMLSELCRPSLRNGIPARLWQRAGAAEPMSGSSLYSTAATLGGAPVVYRQQFRIYAESCLRAAECSKSPTQKAHLFATANAFHQLAQDLELRDELTTRPPPDKATS